MRGRLARARFMRPARVSQRTGAGCGGTPATRPPAQSLELAPRRRAVHHLRPDAHRESPHACQRTSASTGCRCSIGQTTGMHWQSMKGGRGHHFEAERAAAAARGGGGAGRRSRHHAERDPAAAGGHGRALVRRLRAWRADAARAGEDASPLDVPANAEFILEGTVPPGRAADGGAVRRSLRALLRGGAVPGLQREDGDAAAKPDVPRRRRRQAAAGGQVDRRSPPARSWVR